MLAITSQFSPLVTTGATSAFVANVVLWLESVVSSLNTQSVPSTKSASIRIMKITMVSAKAASEPSPASWKCRLSAPPDVSQTVM